MTLAVEGDAAHGWKAGTPAVFLGAGATPGFVPMFSPDSRWIAYITLTASQTFQVEVRPFPGPLGGPWRISTNYGIYPRWSATSHELLFLDPMQGKVMVAPYAVNGDSFQADKPLVWSPSRIVGKGLDSLYDLHPDGKRVATAAAKAQADLAAALA